MTFETKENEEEEKGKEEEQEKEKQRIKRNWKRGEEKEVNSRSSVIWPAVPTAPSVFILLLVVVMGQRSR